MAQVANTYDTTASRRNRETLSDLIDMITPEETPLYSLIGTEKVSGIKPEWNLDSLSAPNTANRRVQGDIYSFSALTATTRVGNFTQIAMKEFIVAETQEAVSKAGPKSDYNREMLKKGTELRIDMEVTILSNQASLAPTSSVPAQLGGLRAWLASNDDMGATGASGGYNTGTGLVAAATNGTQRAFTKTLLDNTIQATYTSGGSPNTLMVSPYNKRVFSTFMADANVALQRREVKGNSQVTITAAADTYISDFGPIDVIPNRQMARAGAATARNIFLIQPDKLAVGILRPVQEDKDVAKTSDAKPGVLKVEYTLLVKNEAAHGVIADVFGMTAST